jgi:MinD-like ATPase involved in chromosome partitioning or flagellar assembly
MARLDEHSYRRVIERLQSLVGIRVLDCGTGLQEPAARAAQASADQIILVSDAQPATASLMAEAARLLSTVGPPLTLVVNKMPANAKEARNAPDTWQRSVRELAVALEADWPALGLSH